MNDNGEPEPNGDMAPDGFWVRIMWFVIAAASVALFVWGIAWTFGQLWNYLQWGR